METWMRDRSGMSKNPPRTPGDPDMKPVKPPMSMSCVATSTVLYCHSGLFKEVFRSPPAGKDSFPEYVQGRIGSGPVHENDKNGSPT